MNDEEARVQVHEVLGPTLQDAVVSASLTEGTSPRRFTIDECWARGRFEGSLFAPTTERSFAWRGDYIRSRFPLLPRDHKDREIDPNLIWPEIARLNGSPQSALQKALGRDAATVEQVLQIAEQQDILFRLPYWVAPGEASERSPLIYWTDSGLLHRLLGEREPEEMSDLRRGKSYEGFAIGAIVSAAGLGVSARVWGRGQDEIDLVLERSGSPERWAIEITSSQTKKLSAGFHRGREETNPTRAIVIQRQNGPAGGRDGIERMQLIEVLRELRQK